MWVGCKMLGGVRCVGWAGLPDQGGRPQGPQENHGQSPPCRRRRGAPQVTPQPGTLRVVRGKTPGAQVDSLTAHGTNTRREHSYKETTWFILHRTEKGFILLCQRVVILRHLSRLICLPTIVDLTRISRVRVCKQSVITFKYKNILAFPSCHCCKFLC